VHAAFVLALPTFTLERTVARIASQSGANHFVLLSEDDQARLFPAYPATSVTGVCAFDVTESPVDFTADIPEGFWILTIYSSSGDVIYALNSGQSGTGQFTVSVKRAPSLLETLRQLTRDIPEEATGWSVSTANPRGLVVLWMPLVDQAQRNGIAKSFLKSGCRTATPAS
jgi:uncharacterized membrane protein